MKKVFSYVSALCLSLCLLSACSSDDEKGDIIPGQNEVVLDKGTSTNQTVFADETVKNEGIKFTTVGPWKAEVRAVAMRAEGSQVDWLTLSQYQGDKAGEYTLTFTLKQNFTGKDRKAEIRIVCGETVITIMVEQKAGKQDGEKLLRIQSIRMQVVCGEAYQELWGDGNDDDVMYFTYDDQGRVVKVVQDYSDESDGSTDKETYVFHYTSPQEVEVMMKREYGSSGSIPSVSIVNYQYQLFMNEHGCPTRIIEKYVGESNRSGFNQDVFNLTYTADHRLQKITVKEEDGPGLWESNFRYQNGLLVYWQECEDGEEVETWEIPADVLYPHRYPVTMVNLDLNGLFDLADDDFINLFSMVGLTGKMSDCLMDAAPIDDEDDPGEDVVGYMEPGKVIEKVYKRIRFKELPYDMLPLVYTFDKDQILRKITAERWYEYGEESCEVHVGNQLISESNPHLGYQYEIKNRKWTKKGDEKNVVTVSLEYEP